MRFSEIVEDTSDITSVIIDIISMAAAEGMSSLSIDTIQRSLSEMGNDIDNSMLFDVLDSIPVIDNIKDDVIFFGRDGNTASDEPSKDQQDNRIDAMARKQVNKDI
jgi:hypothetical protein